MTTIQEAIFKAVESNDLNKLRILLDLDGADVNIQNEYGNTPLYIASFYNHKEIVAMLLEKVENVNVQNNSGKTLLHIACLRNQKEIVAMLLDKNATHEVINIQNNNGYTTQLIIDE